MWKQISKESLFKPVDSSFLLVFRIGFAVIMLWEVTRYWQYDWIQTFYIEPRFLFKYYGFEWVHPWPGDGMYIHFLILGVLAFFIGIGFLYRISCLLFFLAFSYVFLLDQALYLNHFYLVILFSFLLIFLPANRSFSIDALLWPARRSSQVPVWSLWLLRAQMEILLIFAGLVKINSDWLQLEPLRMWLSIRDDLPVIGHLYTQDWAVAIAAYGVIVLHVVGAPLLLWKKTRLAVFILYVCFHILNHFTFSIGIFPWMTILGTLVFFDPDWPRLIRSKIDILLLPEHRQSDTPHPAEPAGTASPLFTTPQTHNIVAILFVSWVLIQILFPLRHWLYPGNVSWHEQGHRFAWQMKLRDKKGFADFSILDPASGRSWYVSPEKYLKENQAKKMATQPDMILQFAHYLEKQWKKEYGLHKVEIRVNNYVSLNGREPAPMVNPSIDLTTIKRGLSPADWILPLHEPLKR